MELQGQKHDKLDTNFPNYDFVAQIDVFVKMMKNKGCNPTSLQDSLYSWYLYAVIVAGTQWLHSRVEVNGYEEYSGTEYRSAGCTEEYNVTEWVSE